MQMELSNPDRSKLEKLSADITDLQKQIQAKQIDYQLNVKKIAPDLNWGPGSGRGQGRGKWSSGGGFRGCQGPGSNCFF